MTGTCKISDFGISKRTEDIVHGGAFTAMQGTIFWMAPEVVHTQKKGYNFKIDIWSVGCVVLEMWAGMRPWMGEETVAVMYKVLFLLEVSASFLFFNLNSCTAVPIKIAATCAGGHRSGRGSR